MIRVDKKNKAVIHYLLGGCGLLACFGFVAFFGWAYIFTDSFISVIDDPTAADDLIRNRSEILTALVSISVLYIPYYYVLFFSCKVEYYPEDNQINVDQKKYLLSDVTFSREITYFGLSFVTLNIYEKGYGNIGRRVFISDARLKPFPIWVGGAKWSIEKSKYLG